MSMCNKFPRWLRVVTLALLFSSRANAIPQEPAAPGFEGEFFDLSQTRSRTSSSQSLPDEKAIAQAFLASGANALNKFRAEKIALQHQYIYFPVSPSSSLQSVMGAPPPQGQGPWLAYFRASLEPPRSGKFRFVGLGDSVLAVRVNGKSVLDGRSTFYEESRRSAKVEYLTGPAGTHARALRAGEWINLKSGSRINVEVLVGGSGVNFSAFLMMEEWGVSHPPRTDRAGTAFPLFQIGSPPPPSSAGTSTPDGGVNPQISGSVDFVPAYGNRGGTFQIAKEPPAPAPPPATAPATPPPPPPSSAALQPPKDWTGDFHLVEQFKGRYRCELKMWFRPTSARQQRWEFKMPLVQETETQKNVSMKFVSSSNKPNKLGKERKGSMGDQTYVVQESVEKGDADGRFGVSLVYEMDRYDVTLEPGRPKSPVPPLSPRERRESLLMEPPVTSVLHPEVKKWIKDNGLTRAPGERDLAFAARVQYAISKFFSYNADRRMTLADAIKYRGIACGETSTMFVGIMRANGIPARFRAGRWLTTQTVSPDGKPDPKLHIKADFFAEGIGWVVAEFPLGSNDDSFIVSCIGPDGNFMTMQTNPWEVPNGGFDLRQGFVGYVGGQPQPVVEEWWDVQKLD